MSDTGSIRAQLLAARAAVDAALATIGDAPTALPPTDPLYLDTDDFAARRSVSRSTVRRWIERGMPHRKVGRIVRVVVKDAEAWLERQHV